MTRLTNAFSKKWKNHQTSLALVFAYYNFCRLHSTIEMTRAMKAGLESAPWSLANLIQKTSTLNQATTRPSTVHYDGRRHNCTGEWFAG